MSLGLSGLEGRVSYVVIEVMLALQADPLADPLVLPAPTSCYVMCRSDRQK